jgi:hypothetical protein
MPARETQLGFFTQAAVQAAPQPTAEPEPVDEETAANQS